MESDKKQGLLIGLGLAAMGLFVLLVVGAAGGYWYWTRTPTYSARQIQTAIRTHDVALFEKHFDVEGVVGSAFDAAMAEAQAKSARERARRPGGGSPWEAAGEAMGMGLANMMRGPMIDQAKRGIRRYVETGKVDGASGKFGLNPSGATVTRDGATAILGVPVTDGNGKQQVLRFRMRQAGDYWRVVELANAPELLATVSGGT